MREEYIRKKDLLEEIKKRIIPSHISRCGTILEEDVKRAIEAAKTRLVEEFENE